MKSVRMMKFVSEVRLSFVYVFITWRSIMLATGLRNQDHLWLRIMFCLVILTGLLQLQSIQSARASSFDELEGPEGSEDFGYEVFVLPNGNVVVTDPKYDYGGTSNVGGVFLYDGDDLSLLNTLRGSAANDFSDVSVVVLENGNYVVVNESWNGDAGAVTWCDDEIGCGGGGSVAVSSSNSLVGNTINDDLVGSGGVHALANGHYVVLSPAWDDNKGAATWCDGTSGRTGSVSSANSRVGSTSGEWGDKIGNTEDNNGLIELSNGNFVVSSRLWNTFLGAVTWCSGTAACTGAVSSSNSLVGAASSDQIGNAGVTALTNGNYVVNSSYVDYNTKSNCGASTFCNGASGCTGSPTTSNTIYGDGANNNVGSDGSVALSNGNYVVISSSWDNGGGVNDNYGAVTWCSGTTGCTDDYVSTSNSIYGSTRYDYVGNGGVIALNNGNYVAASPSWDNGVTPDVGAATWGNGTSGTSGAVSTSNSLYGSTGSDQVGYKNVGADLPGIYTLSNGNYVVASRYWDNGGVSNAGAVTWCNGTSGRTGTVSTSNSLYGSTANDYVGSQGIVSLTNGHFVALSPYWDDGGTSDVGAATWCSGTTGCTGAVTTSNSLYGSTASDNVGLDSALALEDSNYGNYVVSSHYWDRPVAGDGTTVNAGAMTWCSGSSGCSGPVSEDNSLVGNTAADYIGYNSGGDTIEALADGNFIAKSNNFAYDGTGKVGAITHGFGPANTTYWNVRPQTSFIGPSTYNTGQFLSYDWDATNERVVIGQRYTNKVYFFYRSSTSWDDGDWSSADTWDFGVPEDGEDVDIGYGTTVSLDGNESIDDLWIHNSATLNVGEDGYDLAFSGDWTHDGTFTPGEGTVWLTGSGVQSINTSGVLGFNNLNVSTGAVLVDEVSTDNLSVTGTLTNIGTIRKTKTAVQDTDVTFGLSEVVVHETSAGTLGDVTVDWIESDHPNASGDKKTGRYWTITPVGTGEANLTVPVLFTPEDTDNLCRWDDPDWDCDADSYDDEDDTITRNGITQFSDWTAEEVNLPTPTTALESDSNPSTYDDEVTFTATVSGASGTPTGTVTFKDGTTTLGTDELDGSGVATYSTSSLTAGTHSITAEYGGDTNYASSTSDPVSQQVNKATATVTLSDLTQTYDGTQKNASATTDPAGLTVDFTYDGSGTAPTNAGSYAVVGTIDDINYHGSDSGTMTINKGTATVTLGSLTQTYDGTTKSATSTTSPTGLTVNITYDGSAIAPTNAGQYAVVGTINDSNYQGSSNGTMTINKATATVTLSDLTYTYDGTAKSATATTNPEGLTVDITYDGSDTAPTNAGEYAAVGTINETNYQGSDSQTFTINKAAATVTLGSLTHSYDGTSKSATATTDPAGLTVDFTYDGSSTAPTNAGSYAVVGTINETNYQGSDSGTFTINTAASITVQNTNDSGAGSLRAALANLSESGTVDFDSSLSGGKITLTSGELNAGLDKFTIQGPNTGELTIDGNENGRIFNFSGEDISLSNLTLIDGLTDESGGAIYADCNSLTLTNVVISNSQARIGGGAVAAEGELVIDGGRFENNRLIGGGRGGALVAFGDLEVDGTQFISNFSDGIGGGLSIVEANGDLTNVLFYGNLALQGSALDIDAGSKNVDILNNTVMSPTLEAYSGWAIYVRTGTVGISNTLVTSYTTGIENDGGTVSQDYNLFYGNTTDTVGTITGGDHNITQDPLLGELGDYDEDGDVMSVPLLPDSAAFDVASAGVCSDEDARGIDRPQGDGCDIGAYESQGFTLEISGGDDQSAIIGVQFGSPLEVTLDSPDGLELDGYEVTFTGPSSGAGITPAIQKVDTSAGVASFTPTANDTVGEYRVSAEMSGFEKLWFDLTNLDDEFLTYLPFLYKNATIWPASE
jgi:hypothetical protein